MRRKRLRTLRLLTLLTCSRAKQYKEHFKLWAWQKYLPGEKAQWMVQKANKRKREYGKETEFYHGGKMWPKERAEASAKRSKAQDKELVIMGECLMLPVFRTRMQG